MVELVRLRSLKEEPVILETVIQPLSVFPDIDRRGELPNSLYTLYQEAYGVSIAAADDELRAAALPRRFAKHLALPAGTPILVVERSSRHIDGRVVEFSTAYCSTRHFVYSVALS